MDFLPGHGGNGKKEDVSSHISIPRPGSSCARLLVNIEINLTQIQSRSLAELRWMIPAALLLLERGGGERGRG